MSEDPRIREALKKDEYEIAGMLHAVSESDASRRAVLALEGDDAQKFFDVVQDVRVRCLGLFLHLTPIFSGHRQRISP
jgi:hypothetical protein